MRLAWSGMVLGLGMSALQLGCVVTVDGDDQTGIAGAGGNGGSGPSPGGGAGGFGGDPSFPAPTCEPEAIDEGDECVQCFKRNCCAQWLDCADQTCTNEWIDVAECVESEPFADIETLGACISESSEAGDGFVRANTQALLDCAITPIDSGLETLCSSECFGTDIFAF